MFTFTLYDDSSPPKALETRSVGEGIVTVGRDPAVDWVIDDPNRLISRHHLDLRVWNSTLKVRSIGRHSVYAGDPPRRLDRDVETEIQAGETISVGLFRIVVEDAPELHAPPAPQGEVLLGDISPDGHALFDAFCEGAKIDPSQLIAEDPTKILREVGAVYRQAVLGLSKLMRSRNEVRAEILADRTMIGGHENNLIKWAPPHRLAVDLLTSRQEAFLAGSKAVKLSFDDLETHIDGLLAGHRAAVKQLLDSIRPSVLDARAPRGILRENAAEAWAVYTRAYAEIECDLADPAQSVLGNGFAGGYEHGARKRSA